MRQLVTSSGKTMVMYIMRKIFCEQGKIKKTIYVIINYMVTLLIATSLLWTPQKILDCDVERFEATTTYEPSDMDELVNCTMDEAGNFVVIGEDPNIIINNITKAERVMMIKFIKPLSQDVEMEVFYNEGWGFNEAQKIKKIAKENSTYAYFVFPNASYTDIRIDVGISCQIESIQFGNEGLIETNATNKPFWYIEAFFIASLTTIGIYLIEKKTKIVEEFHKYISNNKESIINTIRLLMVLALISVMISFAICELIHDIGLLSVKGMYTLVVIAAFVFFLICGIVCVWHYRKALREDFEKAFVIMTLIIGLSMIVCAPFAHLSWDTDNHYRMALDASYLGDTKITQSDYLIRLPAYDTLIKDTADGNFINMGILSFGYKEVISSYDNAKISLAHMPSGIFIAMGRLMRLPFIAIYALGKIPNLLIYVGLCYLAMKQLRDGKLILAVFALFPTNLLLATNYSYDYWVTGFMLLGMAYFVGILQHQERNVTGKDAFVISASFALACLPKLIYFPLLLIPFLMPPKRIKDKKKYYVIVLLMLVALVAMFVMASMVQTNSVGDTRGGSTVGPADQLAYAFSDIWNYAIILVRFLFTEYLTIANMENYISNYAYLGVAGGSTIFLVLLVFVFLFDKDEVYTKELKSDWINRVYTVLMYFGGAALVASSMYVAFTPVGLDTILGCQARYMIPWIYPLLSIWSMNRVKPIISKKILCWAVVLGCYGLLFYNVAMLYLPSVACLG